MDFIKGIVFWALISFVIASCGDTEEESILINDPKVDMMFFNIDSLLKVNDTLGIVNDSLIVLEDSSAVLTDTIIVLSDSLVVLDQLIEDGQGGLIPVRDQFRADSTILATNLEIVKDADSVMMASQDFWVMDSTNIASGKVLVSEVENLINGNTFAFTDSATIFSIPLDMNADSSVLQLTLGGEKFSVELEYSRVESLGNFGKVTIQVFDLMLKSHSFESAKVDCKNNSCIDSETTIRLYF